jgi:hypothetical protein
MTTPPPPSRFTLRDLPVPAKLVLTVFLISVGLGYFSALVQLHMQHSARDGEPMPSVADVIEKFAGLKAFDGVQPKSKIEAVVSGPRDGAFDKNNMTPAFFAKSGSSYEKDCKERGKDVVDKEREGERLALIAWCNSDPPGKEGGARERAYVNDEFKLPEALEKQPITEDFFDTDKKTVMIKSLIEARCGKCHGGDKKPDLDEYPKIAPLATAPPLETIDDVFAPDKKWQRSTRQLTVEGLTQSTHAHMLSFSMLFAMTGLVFAFTTYPGVVRGVIGPVVLVAQIADISCWWLARSPGYGPYFATAIVGTGAVVGLGLATQILLSMFNMYGQKGKAVLFLICLIGLAVVSVVWVKAIAPGLEEQQRSKTAEISKDVEQSTKDPGKKS